VVTKEYIDEGYSGELLDRPGLDSLRDDARNKLFDAVLVHSPTDYPESLSTSGLLMRNSRRLA
jgi:site-specific DNA recombinase